MELRGSDGMPLAPPDMKASEELPSPLPPAGGSYRYATFGYMLPELVRLACIA
jgi:hypothetical protein